MTFRLRSTFSHFAIRFSALIIYRIISNLPAISGSTEVGQWEYLGGLPLVDPQFWEPSPINILVGADIYGRIIEDGLIMLSLHPCRG